MTRTVTIALLFLAASTSRAIAQESLKGFWVLDSIQCVPRSVQCSTLPERQDSWSAQLAIDVLGQGLVVSGPSMTPLMQHADTFYVEGRYTYWLKGRRGIARDSSRKGDSYGVGATISRHLWDGESWRVSEDATSLIHEYHWTTRAGSTERIVLTYRRAAR